MDTRRCFWWTPPSHISIPEWRDAWKLDFPIIFPWWSGFMMKRNYHPENPGWWMVLIQPCLEDRVLIIDQLCKVCWTQCSCSVSQCVKAVCDLLWLVLRISLRDLLQLLFLTLEPLLNVTGYSLTKRETAVSLELPFFLLPTVTSQQRPRPSLRVGVDSLQTL